MKVVSQQEVAANFAEYVKASRKGPVMVTSRGKPVAVLLKADSDEELERLLMGHSAKLQSILEAARQRFREGRGIPHETFWKDVAEGAKQTGRASRPARNGRKRR